MAKYAFISYARPDRARVEKIARGLESRGVRVWWDPEIQTGAGFRAEISEALAKADVVVVVWSKDSVTSRFVCDEADDGAARGILYPALVDSVDIPLGFRQIQTADLTRWRGKMKDRAFVAFLDTIAKGASTGRSGPAPTPAPHPKPQEARRPKKKPRPRKVKEPKARSIDASRYTTTGAKQRAGLLFRSIVLTLLAAAGFGAIAYGADFIFAAYRPFFVGGLAVLAFLSRYGTFQADRAIGAASTHLMSRSYMSLMFFSLILLAPIILEGRMYAAALEGVQVRGITGADINGVSFDASGKRLLTASDDGAVRVWDVESGVQRGEFRGHRKDAPESDDKWVWAAAFSPDGKRAASASRDRTVRIWTTGIWKTGIISQTAILEGHGRSVYDVAWHPGGEVIASASGDGAIRIWDPKSGELIRTLTGHSASVSAIDFQPDGGLLASASADGTIRLWDWESGARRRYAGAGGGEVNDVRFSHDGAMVAAITDGGRVRVWRTDGLSRVADIRHGARGYSLSFLSGDREIATSGVDGVIRVWNIDDQSLKRELAGHKDAIRSLDSTRDGAALVSGSRDNTARIWDAATGRETQTMGHVKAAFPLPVAIDAPPVLAASRAPAPMNFRAEPAAAARLVGKGAAIAGVLMVAALILKGLFWVIRLRPLARSMLTGVLFAAAAYIALLMVSALPIEALWLWLTLGFVPAALLALARWAAAAPLAGARTARRRQAA